MPLASAVGALQPRDIAQLAQVTELVRRVLGDAALGAWLYGSAVDSRLRPSSDLDVLVVSTRATSEADRRPLIDGLLPISGARAADGPARSIELTIVVQADIRPWRYPPRLDFQYGDWWRAEFEHGDLAPWTSPNPDLAILLASVRERAHTLFGPPVVDIVAPVARVDVVRAMLDSIPDLLADLDDDTRNVVLTLARVWTTLATGEIRSKDAAADWALEQLPEEHRPVLTRARDGYLGGEAGRWDDRRHEVGRHVDHVVARIRAEAQSR
jgi:streptomycin 3"-adenylyltransferase